MTIEESIFVRHTGKDILVDSNLLLVLISGSVDYGVLKRFKRVRQYTPADYELLVRFLHSFRRLITTPHILTEVSNLANSLPGDLKKEWFNKFAALVSLSGRTIVFKEEWTPAEQLAASADFVAFGITDAALSRISATALILTEDYRLSGVLRSRGRSVLNFDELRRLRALANG